MEPFSPGMTGNIFIRFIRSIARDMGEALGCCGHLKELVRTTSGFFSLDEAVTPGELSDYLKEHVPYMARRLKGVEQQPVIMGNAGDVLAVLKK